MKGTGTLYYTAQSTEASRQKQTLSTDVHTQQKEKNSHKMSTVRNPSGMFAWLSSLQFHVPCTYSNKFAAIMLLIAHKNTFKS